MSYIDWLDSTRPAAICAAVRLDTRVTAQPWPSRPMPSCRPAWPAPIMVILRMLKCSTVGLAPTATGSDACNVEQRGSGEYAVHAAFMRKPQESFECSLFAIHVAKLLRYSGYHLDFAKVSRGVSA
ncbi:hypothetical protein FQZ97_1149870 [compost metagenome]